MNKHTLQSAQSIHACNYHLLISLSSPTFPDQPHSEQLHSTLDPPETSSLGDSANHQPAYWEEGRHHQMASPGKISRTLSSTWVKVSVCVFLHAHHHIDAIFFQWRFVIGDITDPNNCGGTIMLQILIDSEYTDDYLCMCWEDKFLFLTSMKELSVLSVGLCVIRNLMFLWHSSTGAGRFMVARGPTDL